MKKEFSKHWKSSKQPRKQRKYLAKAPLHIKRKMISSSLAKPLRKKAEKRSAVLRTGDNVKVMRGKFKGKSGKVVKIVTDKIMVEVEGIQIKKKDGSKINVKMRPSNLQITELNLEDKRRRVGKTKPAKKEESKNSNEKKETKAVKGKKTQDKESKGEK